MNNEKTIKQLSDELGVSKQTIQKIIEKIPNEYKPSKLGNRYLLSQENQNYIKKKLGVQIDNDPHISNNKTDKTHILDGKTDNSDKIKNKTNNSDIHEYLSIILSQLDVKDKQIEKLQKLLDQQQILTLQANKKIEELELKNDEQTEKEEESVSSQNHEVKEAQTKKSFWSKFFGN